MKLEIMLSVNPPYSKMIMCGEKPFEFRNSILNAVKALQDGENITAYIYETKNKGGCGMVIGRVKITGLYDLHYNDKRSTTTELINARYRSIKYLYLHWCCMNALEPNMNEGWFKSKRFTAYKEKIGFGGNYALILDSPITFCNQIDISYFNYANGKVFRRPPQNMCYVADCILKD